MPLAAGLAVGYLLPSSFLGENTERVTFALFVALALSVSSLAVVAKILSGLGWLRVPREVELAGLDTHDYGDAFPYFPYRDTQMEEMDCELARGQGS